MNYISLIGYIFSLLGASKQQEKDCFNINRCLIENCKLFVILKQKILSYGCKLLVGHRLTSFLATIFIRDNLKNKVCI